MDIRKTQYYLADLLKNVRHPRLGSVLGLQEEVGELAKNIMNWEIYDERDLANLEDELADCFFSLLDISNAYQVDLETACDKKLESMKNKVAGWEEKYASSLKKKRELLD